MTPKMENAMERAIPNATKRCPYFFPPFFFTFCSVFPPGCLHARLPPRLTPVLLTLTYAFTIARKLVCDALPDVGTKRTRTVNLRLCLSSLCLRRRMTEARARAESATFRV